MPFNAGTNRDSISEICNWPVVVIQVHKYKRTLLFTINA